jgi:small subunit ribosomal protein S6
VIVAVLAMKVERQPLAHLASTPITTDNLATAVTLTLFAIIGFETGTAPVGKVRNPMRTIPLALIAGTAFCVILYLVSSTSVSLILSPEAAAKSLSPYADALKANWGESAAQGGHRTNQVDDQCRGGRQQADEDEQLGGAAAGVGQHEDDGKGRRKKQADHGSIPSICASEDRGKISAQPHRKAKLASAYEIAVQATKIIEDNDGKVVKTENWGLRSLAYRIAKNRKAHYVALDLDAPAAAIAELERQSNINEDVIRFLTIRVDELEKGPSAMMRRGDKDRERRSDRGDRDDRPSFRAREEEVE